MGSHTRVKFNILLILNTFVLVQPIVASENLFNVEFKGFDAIEGSLGSQFVSSLKQWIAHSNAFVPEAIRQTISSSIKHTDLPLVVSLSDDCGPLYRATFLPKERAMNGSVVLEICLARALLNSRDFLPKFVHEYFHALHYALFARDVDKPKPWVEEGLAEWFVHRVFALEGEPYFNSSAVRAALTRSETSLTQWFDRKKISDSNTVEEQYGHALLYFYYLWNHCLSDLDLSDRLIWEIVLHSNKNGEGIEKVLQSEPAVHSVCENFRESVVSFEIARAHNRTSREPTNPHTLLIRGPYPSLIPSMIEGGIDEISRIIELSLPFAPRIFQVNSTLEVGQVLNAKGSSGDSLWIELDHEYPYATRRLDRIERFVPETTYLFINIH